MSVKHKPCTTGPKHKWEWKLNTTVRQFYETADGDALKVTRYGVYRCTCGVEKYGEPKELEHAQT